MKDYWKETTEKKLNKKKIMMITIIAMIIIVILLTMVIYCNNKTIREWIDKNIFRKEVIQDNVSTIELTENHNSNICAFNKYIGVLNKNKFTIYGNIGNEEKSLEVEASTPIFDSASRFLAMAEKKGKKLYLITEKDITWEANVEGNISQIHVNKNGYVAVVIEDTSYKTVIIMYNPNGKEMFKVDTSGTIIQSNIKIISIDKAKSDPTNSLENTYKGEPDKLITNIEYQDKDRLICMYTDDIHMIENNQDITLMENQNKKMIFQSVELVNHAIQIEEKSSGLFTADSVIHIVNTENRTQKDYTVNAVTKEIYTYSNMIALNLGTEVEFINTDGWLVKRYIANQEITNIVVSNNIAGVIYRDKIEIIDL